MFISIYEDGYVLYEIGFNNDIIERSEVKMADKETMTVANKMNNMTDTIQIIYALSTQMQM